MTYKYYPDSYNYNSVDEKFGSRDDFLLVQLMYRRGIEKILKEYINFSELDNLIFSNDVLPPVLDDNIYNFYHAFSTLGSKYIFFRNNIHVENLSIDEINTLRSMKDFDESFFLNTLAKVIFEKGDSYFVGLATMNKQVDSRSIVFEFAFDQKKCVDIEQYLKIQKAIELCFNKIKSCMEKSDFLVNFVIYEALPDIFLDNDLSKSK